MKRITAAVGDGIYIIMSFNSFVDETKALFIVNAEIMKTFNSFVDETFTDMSKYNVMAVHFQFLCG